MAILVKQQIKEASLLAMQTLVDQIVKKTDGREGPFTVFVADTKKHRSLRQNRYLWGVVYKYISDYLGYDTEELHEYFKLKFALRTKFAIDTEDILEVPQSTKRMDTKEMTEFIDKIIRWAAEKDIHIPSPGDESLEDYINAMSI